MYIINKKIILLVLGMEDIDILIKNYFEKAVQDMQDLIKINSQYDRNTVDETCPFGAGAAECLNKFISIAESDGFTVRNIENYAGYAELGEGELIGILSHLDVVPAGNENLWKYPPFAAEIHDNKLYGRGAIDDKGPLIAVYTALKILKDSGIKFNKRFRIIAGCDEETSMRCLKKYNETEEIPSFSFSPDANFPAVYAEKGQMQITMNRDFPLQGFEPVKLLGLTCGERVNVVPDTAYAYFAGDTAKIKRQLEEIAGDDLEIDYYQQDYLQVKATGKSAHAMNPEKGINAMYKLLRYLAHPSLDYGSWELMLWIRQVAFLLTDDCDGRNFNINCSDDISGNLTINLGIVRYKTEDLTLKFDIRYPVTIKSSKMENKIHNLAEKMMMLTQISKHIPPLFVDKNNPYLKELLKAYQEVTSDYSEPIAIGGRTYCTMMPNSLSFGANFKDDEELAHQNNEYIDLDKFKKLIKIYIKALINLNNM